MVHPVHRIFSYFDSSIDYRQSKNKKEIKGDKIPYVYKKGFQNTQ